MALAHQATGANVTVSGGDDSFEQALLAAHFLAPEKEPVLVMAADEGHEKLSPLFDPSVAARTPLSDGGGVLYVSRGPIEGAPAILLKHFETGNDSMTAPDQMVQALGDLDDFKERIGLILAGIPATQRQQGQAQLNQFISLTGYAGPILDYRKQVGEFASASAVAAVFAAAMVKNQTPPLPGRQSGYASGAYKPAVLVLGLGSTLTAMEVSPHESTPHIG